MRPGEQEAGQEGEPEEVELHLELQGNTRTVCETDCRGGREGEDPPESVGRPGAASGAVPAAEAGFRPGRTAESRCASSRQSPGRAKLMRQREQLRLM